MLSFPLHRVAIFFFFIIPLQFYQHSKFFTVIPLSPRPSVLNSVISVKSMLKRPCDPCEQTAKYHIINPFDMRITPFNTLASVDTLYEKNH